MAVTVELATGALTLDVERADWPLDALCGFALRRNRRRGYLVVSKVLGRHIPARPALMRASARDLAAKLPADLPGPVLMLGLAETAVCLGQTVHEEYLRRTGRDDVAWLHSTRQTVDAPLLARFEEPHSHAPAHLIHTPTESRVRDAVLGARSLVLVDDEASSGTTFVNLAAALAAVLPRLEAVATAVLTDWSGGGYLERMPRGTTAAGLLAGTLTWTPDPAATQDDDPGPAPAGFGRAPRGTDFGRLGKLDVADEGDALAAGLGAGRPLLVVGTGEFTYPPFRLAEALERAGAEVHVQATTRSPVRVGGAIGAAMDAPDPYGSAAPHFLYNQRLDPARDVLVCHETGEIDPAFLRALGARALRFG